MHKYLNRITSPIDNIPTIINTELTNKLSYDDLFLQSELSSMTLNGGPCLYRTGLWSQSIRETTVYFLLEKILGICDIDDTNSQHWNIHFSPRYIEILYNNEPILLESLEYIVVPTECTWTFEFVKNKHSKLMPFIVLHFQKAASVEWFPGCEWWDRVFESDEPIETLTCSVGTDMSDLPTQALNNAQREHERFINLTTEQQTIELNALERLKAEFNESEIKTRDEAILENKAINENPSRSQIGELRNEFPHINFSFK